MLQQGFKKFLNSSIKRHWSNRRSRSWHFEYSKDYEEGRIVREDFDKPATTKINTLIVKKSDHSIQWTRLKYKKRRTKWDLKSFRNSYQ